MLEPNKNYQLIWRIVGVLCLAGCALLVWFGPTLMTHGLSFFLMFLYWSGFLLLLGAAFYVAILDIRYIRLQYLLAERELFHETMDTIKKTQAERDAAAREADGGDEIGSSPK